jgi:uncharacterized protein (TIGR03790 family)
MAACVVGLLGASAPEGLALTAREVLVVANAAVPDSVALAQLYARTRGIDANQILLLKLSGNTDISREAYDTQVLEPLRKALKDRNLNDRIRCICTIYGIPYRVAGPADDPEEALFRAANVDLTKMHYQLVIDYKLLGTVGREFPEPRTTSLEPMGALFAPSMEAPKEPLPSISTVIDDIRKLLPAKHAELAKIANADHQRIAQRQLMALHLELEGPQGLIDYVRAYDPERAPDMRDLEKQLRDSAQAMADVQRRQLSPEALTAAMGAMRGTGGLMGASSYLEKLKDRLSQMLVMYKSGAALDSEIALVHWQKYPLRGPSKNLLNWQTKVPAGTKLEPTLMVSRLDGAGKIDVERMIVASMVAELRGLTGTCYVDSGGPDRVALETRKEYDAKLTALATFLQQHSKTKVVLDTKPTLFEKDSCPNAALYVGWYSLQKYIDAFKWNPGAVGWHVASWEAVHLRDPKTQEWCVKMIQNGVAATIGAVAEPLLPAFPEPNEFMPLLMTGKYTIAECYWRTVPHSSWQMMLLADPLYNPFKTNPQVQVKDLPAGLAP